MTRGGRFIRSAFFGMVACIFILSPGRGQSLSVVDGDIVQVTVDHGRVRLTAGGADYDPSASTDGKQVVFVRRGIGSEKDVDELGQYTGNELWTVNAGRPDSARKILSNAPGSSAFVGLRAPQFSQDTRSVYFLNWYGNGYSLQRVQIATGQVEGVVDSVDDYWVLRTGVFRGDLVAIEDHLKVLGGHMVLYWLISGGGHSRRLIGNDKADLKRILTEGGVSQ